MIQIKNVILYNNKICFDGGSNLLEEVTEAEFPDWFIKKGDIVTYDKYHGKVFIIMDIEGSGKERKFTMSIPEDGIDIKYIQKGTYLMKKNELKQKEDE